MGEGDLAIGRHQNIQCFLNTPSLDTVIEEQSIVIQRLVISDDVDI